MKSCELNQKLIIQRHDHLKGKIPKKLKRGNPTETVWIERHWRQELQLVKPDITMIDKGHCSIIKLTCPYETSIAYLDQRAQDKVVKYKPLLKDLKQVDCHCDEIISLVISSLGTISNWTNTQLCQLKLRKFKEALQMTVIKDNVNILNYVIRHHSDDG